MPEDKPIEIPNNIEDCQSLIKGFAKQINELTAKNYALTLKINELTHRLQLLTKQKYGKKAEKLNVEQLKTVLVELMQEENLLKL